MLAWWITSEHDGLSRGLEDAGLVEHRAHGARSVYAVRVQGLASVPDFLDEFWDTALSQLEELAKE